MKSARTIRDNYGFRVRCSDILNECKLLNANQLLFKSAMRFIIKLMLNKKPTELYNLLILPSRKCKRVNLVEPPKTSHTFKYGVFYKIVNIFNFSGIQLNDYPLKKQLKDLDKLICAFPNKDWLVGSQT